MRCLLDKVTARYTVQGLLKLAGNQNLTPDELFVLDLFSRAAAPEMRLFVARPTTSVLQQLSQMPRYSPLIQIFLNRVEVAQPTHYFKRWARRLRDFEFTREDAAILALATFGTDQNGAILGMSFVATFDRPMLQNWSTQQTAIHKRLMAMQPHIPTPYRYAQLPQVLLPQQIIF